MNDDELQAALRRAAEPPPSVPDHARLLEAFARTRPVRTKNGDRASAVFLAALALSAVASLTLRPSAATRRADRGLALRTQQIARAVHVPEFLIR